VTTPWEPRRGCTASDILKKTAAAAARCALLSARALTVRGYRRGVPSERGFATHSRKDFFFAGRMCRRGASHRRPRGSSRPCIGMAAMPALREPTRHGARQFSPELGKGVMPGGSGLSLRASAPAATFAHIAMAAPPNAFVGALADFEMFSQDSDLGRTSSGKSKTGWCARERCRSTGCGLRSARKLNQQEAGDEAGEERYPRK